MFKKILVPTDGSSHAVKAQRLAVDLASKYGADLIFLSVIEGGSLTQAARQLAVDKGVDLRGFVDAPEISVFSPEGAPIVPKADVTLASSRIQAELAELLIGEATAQARAAGLKKVIGLTHDGNVAETILKAAAENGVDLIVMGSRGLGNLKALLAGSVSQKVSNLAECSCITVK